MNEPLLLGCDLGTSAAKTILVSAAGEVVARASAGYPMAHPRPGWAETDPASWWTAMAHTIRTVVSACEDPRRIAGLAVVAQREAAVLLRDGQPLLPAI